MKSKAIIPILFLMLVYAVQVQAQTQITGHELVVFESGVLDSVGHVWWMPDSVKIIITFFGDDPTINDYGRILMYEQWFDTSMTGCDSVGDSAIVFYKEFDQMVDTLRPGIYYVSARFYESTLGLDYRKSRIYHVLRGDWATEDLREAWLDERWKYIDPNAYDSGIALEGCESTTGWKLGTSTDSSAIVLNSDNYLEGAASVKLVVRQANAYASMFKTLETADGDTAFEPHQFGVVDVDFYVNPDLKKHWYGAGDSTEWVIEHIRVIFSADTSLPLTNYAYYEIGANEIVAEWNSKTFLWDGFTEVGVINKDWVIRMVGFEIKADDDEGPDHGGDSCEVSFDNVRYGRRSREKIILLFADANDEHLSVAAPLMNKYHFRGCEEIITGTIGQGGSLTWPQVDTLHRIFGWDGINHSTGGQSTMRGNTDDSLDLWINGGYADLVQHCPISAPFYVHPAEQCDSAIIRKLKERHYFACAGTNSIKNRIPRFLAQRDRADSNALFCFPSAGLGGSGTLAAFKAAVDTAMWTGSFALFSWHTLTTAGEIKHLDSCLAYLYSKRANVVVFSDMLREELESDVKLDAIAAEDYAENLAYFFGACDDCYYRLFPEGGEANKDSLIVIDPSLGADSLVGKIQYLHGTEDAIYDTAFFFRAPWW